MKYCCTPRSLKRSEFPPKRTPKASIEPDAGAARALQASAELNSELQKSRCSRAAFGLADDLDSRSSHASPSRATLSHLISLHCCQLLHEGTLLIGYSSTWILVAPAQATTSVRLHHHLALSLTRATALRSREQDKVATRVFLRRHHRASAHRLATSTVPLRRLALQLSLLGNKVERDSRQE